MKLQQIN